jgi:hypothetical protein
MCEEQWKEETVAELSLQSIREKQTSLVASSQLALRIETLGAASL